MNAENLLRFGAPPLIALVVWLLSGDLMGTPPKYGEAWRLLAMATPVFHLMSIGPTRLIESGGFLCLWFRVEPSAKLVARMALFWLVTGVAMTALSNQLGQAGADPRTMTSFFHVVAYATAHACLVAAFVFFAYSSVRAVESAHLPGRSAGPARHAGTQAVSARVFLSYRREDAVAAALLVSLYDRLAGRYEKSNVFRDFDSIPAGTDFREATREAIRSCDAFLCLIGPDWLRILRERPPDEADYVRIEIETAIQSGVAVIPVLAGGARMPADRDIPESISSLAFRNAVNLSYDDNFDSQLRKLFATIDRIAA